MILSILEFLCLFWLFLGLVVAVGFTAFVITWLILGLVHFVTFIIGKAK